MADVETRTEDWNTLPWKDIQKNVSRLQRRIYQAARRKTSFTAQGVYDKDSYPEEPREGKTLTRGSGAGVGVARPRLTVT